MNCAICGHTATKVIDSRESRDSVRRRRECINCHGRFTTYERAYVLRLQVQKRNGAREKFSVEKVSRSLEIACAKRPIPLGAISQMVRKIHDAIAMDGKECVNTSVIGEMALQQLMELDQVAYMRYASVYRDFTDPESFSDEARWLLNEERQEEISQGRLLQSDALYKMRRKAGGKLSATQLKDH